MGRTIVVVGAAGFLGRSIVQALTPTGCHVVGLDVVAPTDVAVDEWIVADLSRQDLPDDLFARADVIIYLAWRNIPASGNSDMRNDVTGNVATAVQIFEQAALNGTRRIIYASSGGTIYGRAPVPTSEREPIAPIGGYGAGKAAAEIYLNALHSAHGIPMTTLRIANPYGPGQLPDRGQGFIGTAIAHALQDRPIDIFGTLDVSRDYIFVDDVANAVVLACASDIPQSILNVGSGQARSLAEILDLVFAAVGRSVPIRHFPGRAMDIPAMALDIGLITTTYGWQPRTGIEDGMATTVDWMARHLGIDRP